MRRIALLLATAIILALASYAVLSRAEFRSPTQVPPAPTKAVRAASVCGPTSAPDYFFPSDSIEPRDRTIDDNARRVFSQVLRAMHEPSLACGDASGESYRLLRVDSVLPPVAVRVTHSGDDTALSVVELEGPAWKRLEHVTRRAEKKLSADEWRSIESAMAGANFWTMDAYAPSSGDSGWPWILEGRRGTGYHVVHRASPADGPFRSACSLLLRLADVADKRR